MTAPSDKPVHELETGEIPVRAGEAGGLPVHARETATRMPPRHELETDAGRPAPAAPALPETIGDYEILREIARGGASAPTALLRHRKPRRSAVAAQGIPCLRVRRLPPF